MVDRSFLTWNEREQPVGLGLTGDPERTIWLRCYVNGVEVRMWGQAATVNALLNRLITPPDNGTQIHVTELKTGDVS